MQRPGSHWRPETAGSWSGEWAPQGCIGEGERAKVKLERWGRLWWNLMCKAEFRF